MTCHGWSVAGEQEQYAHSSKAAHACWLEERRAWHQDAFEDLFFVECTPRYPVKDKLASQLDGLCTVLHVVDDQELHGWPHKRRRVLAVALNNKAVRWVGPVNYQADFARRFHRGCALDGTALLARRRRRFMRST